MCYQDAFAILGAKDHSLDTHLKYSDGRILNGIMKPTRILPSSFFCDSFQEIVFMAAGLSFSFVIVFKKSPLAEGF